jgi:hypothetical protein
MNMKSVVNGHRLGMLLVVLAFSFLGGCRTARIPIQEEPAVVEPGPLQLYYEEAVLDKSPSPDSRFDPWLESESMDTPDFDGITEISLEMTECYGTCPAYTVTFYSDGRATFEGRSFIDPIGSYRAEIPTGYFRRLARAALDIGYFGLAETYVAPVTDMATVYTSIVRGGARKTVRNYGNSGPSKLWLLEGQIDAARASLKWKPAASPGSAGAV